MLWPVAVVAAASGWRRDHEGRMRAGGFQATVAEEELFTLDAFTAGAAGRSRPGAPDRGAAGRPRRFAVERSLAHREAAIPFRAGEELQ